jgi:thioredoxin-related protein
MLLRAVLLLSLSSQVFGIDNLKLNSKLDYSSDSLDGPLITGNDAQSGFVSGKTNYVIIYGEDCFNSKRQARRTVELYNKYRDQVHFVVVDLDEKRSPDQQKLVKEYYEGSIPHVLILDANGKRLYNSPGEVDSKHISSIFEQSFSQASGEGK